MAAGKFSLGNLTLFVDLNGLQIAGAVSEIGGDNQYGKALQAFGWQVLEIVGHDFAQIEQAVLEAEAYSRPTAILCHTVKGKGVSFMENQAGWHGKAPNAMPAGLVFHK